MRKAFDIVMRFISSLAGVAMFAMGTVWTLQGLGIAFQVGFMANNRQWAVYGIILALFGIAQIIWTNIRRV